MENKRSRRTAATKIAKEEVKKEVVASTEFEEKPEIKQRKTFRELRRLLHRDTEILVMNNTQGGIYYYCPKTHTEIEMSEFGDTQIVTLEVLEAMKNKAKSLLKKLCLVVVDVYPEVQLEGEIDIVDVLTYLGLEEMYEPINNELENNGEIYSESFFDDLIINKTKDEFNRLVAKFNKGLLINLARRGVYLFETGQFDSRYKMDMLQEKLGVEDLFADIY
jgi:hypothetical protein